MKEALSKFLSYVLRHAPQSIGLTLDAQGWAEVDALIARSAAAGQRFDRAMLAELVAANDKKRFTLSPDGTRIRAAQGHSVAVELGLAPSTPPDRLYHGTATRFLAAILAEGLKPGARQKVHLSADRETARRVGLRHGKPAILIVEAGALHLSGQPFWQADNGVWLTDRVDPAFLQPAEPDDDPNSE